MLSILVFHNTIHPNLKGCLTHMIKGREKILFKISLGHSWLYEAKAFATRHNVNHT
jgi:hypothetical protein